MKNTLDRLAGARGVRWYVLRRDNDEMLRRVLNFELVGKRGRGRPIMTWKRQVEEHIDKIGRKKEDVTDRTKWRNDVYEPPRNVR